MEKLVLFNQVLFENNTPFYGIYPGVAFSLWGQKGQLPL